MEYKGMEVTETGMVIGMSGTNGLSDFAAVERDV